MDKIIDKRNYDHEDPIQQKELKDSLSYIDKKWSTLHTCVKDYRDVLSNTNQFYKLVEEVEVWTEQKVETIRRLISNKKSCQNVKEAEVLDAQIDQNINEANQFKENKIKHLSHLAVKIYGKQF